MSNNNQIEEKDSEFERLQNSNFKQQKLSAWRPVPTITSTTLTFIFFGIVFIAIGVVVIIFSNQIQETIIQYDSCTGTPCQLSFKINVTFTAPVMVYYQLNNFYQNHRRYVKSKSNDQLAGNILSATDIYSDCFPVYQNKHLYKTTYLNGTTLDPEGPANPCGLIAKSLFNDTFFVYNQTTPNIIPLETQDSKLNVNISNKDIAWASDKALKYKRPASVNYTSVLWTDVEDEHFMVWMRPAGLPNFRKLWGRINGDLAPGQYSLYINNIYPVESFKGEKFFILSTVNVFGGKNSFLGISYLCVGAICILMAILFFLGYKAHNKKD